MRLMPSVSYFLIAGVLGAGCTDSPTSLHQAHSFRLVVQPRIDTLAGIGGIIHLKATVDGRDTVASISWISLNGSVATVDSLGTARAVAAGTALIVAALGGEADTATLIVLTGVLVHLDLAPASVTLPPAGTIQFAVSGTWTDSSSTVPVVTYAATGGTITSDGLYSAGATPGTFSVIATQQGGTIADTSIVTISVSTTIYPGDDIQTAVNNNPLGTTFIIKAGIHRMQQVIPRSGDKFEGEPGAILSGAKLLTTFSREGAYWVVSGQTQQGAVHGVCNADRPRCNHPEDLFFDDAPLVHVSSLAEVGPGKWFFDYAAGSIYFADDPAGHKVETSVAAYAFAGAIRDVGISGIVIEKYANPAQHGAIDGSSSARWVVRDNEIRLNHGTGIFTGDGMQVSGNRVHHQGQLGIGGGGADVVVENNEIAYNNTAGFNWYWEAGGTKFSYTTGLIVRGNYSHDNTGPGLWTDINNINTLYEDNKVEDNDGAGIFHEISYAAVIRNNVVARNGWGSHNYVNWPEGSGILVNSSSDVEVVGNSLTDNANGISAIQSPRGDGVYGPWIVENLYVHDNTITQPVGKTGASQDAGDDAIFTQRNNRFLHNTYFLGSNSAPFRWMDGPRTAAEWRAYGMDVDGTFAP